MDRFHKLHPPRSQISLSRGQARQRSDQILVTAEVEPLSATTHCMVMRGGASPLSNRDL